MSKQKVCICGHMIGRHSHMVPHQCKVDYCGCPQFEHDAPVPASLSGGTDE